MKIFKKHRQFYHFKRITFQFKKKQVEDIQRCSECPLIKRIIQKGSVWYRLLWAMALVLCWLLSMFQCDFHNYYVMNYDQTLTKSILLPIVLHLILTNEPCSFVLKVWDRVTYYLSEPVWTSVQLIQNDSLYFPSVTGCIDTYSTKEIVRMRDDFTSQRGIDPCAYQQTNFYTLDKFGLHRELNYSRLIQTALLGEDLRTSCTDKEYPSLLVNGLKACTNTHHIDNMQSCVTTTFNIPVNLIIQSQLSVRWDLPPDKCQRYSDVKDLSVLIHESLYDIPWILWQFVHHEDSVEVERKNGTERFVSLTTTKFTYVSTQRKPCTDDQTYLQCFRKFVDTLVKHPGMKCSLPLYGPLHLKLCQNVSTALSAYFELHENMMRKEIPCPRRCHETLYRRSHERRERHAGRLSVSIMFLDNFEFLSDEAFAYSLVSLLCDIGGNVGLFLGVSLISMFEFMETWCHRCKKHIRSFTVVNCS